MLWCQITIGTTQYSHTLKEGQVSHIHILKEGKVSHRHFYMFIYPQWIGTQHIFVVTSKVDLWILWSNFYESNLHKIGKWLIQTPVRRPWIENDTNILSEEQWNGRAVTSTPNLSSLSAMLWWYNDNKDIIKPDTEQATKKFKTIWNIDLFPSLSMINLSLSLNVPWNVV